MGAPSRRGSILAGVVKARGMVLTVTSCLAALCPDPCQCSYVMQYEREPEHLGMWFSDSDHNLRKIRFRKPPHAPCTLSNIIGRTEVHWIKSYVISDFNLKQYSNSTCDVLPTTRLIQSGPLITLLYNWLTH